MTVLDDLTSFRRLISALRPWLDRVVIIGGWALRLYRLHPRSQQVEYAPLSTFDTDVAIPGELPVTADDIRKRLLEHGFIEEFMGEDRPPATHYRLGAESSGFYAEFLSPLVGSTCGRQGKRKTTARIGGINAQRLRHIDILLIDPWKIEFDLVAIAGERVTMQVANPISFVVQKILIQSGRTREKRAKDVLYIHDTLDVFGRELEALHAEWESRVKPRLQRRHVNAVLNSPDELFGTLTDATRAAAIVAAHRGLTAESLRETCQVGLSQLFARHG